MAKGKYTEWLTPDGLLLLEGWARDGLTDEQIAHNIGINVKTLWDWKVRFDPTCNAIKQGKAPVDIQVENALLKRALGYEYEEVTTEITETPYIDRRGKERVRKQKHVKKTKKIVLPDTTAQIFWLKNRRPDKWRDKREEAVSIHNADPHLDEEIERMFDDAARGNI